MSRWIKKCICLDVCLSWMCGSCQTRQIRYCGQSNWDFLQNETSYTRFKEENSVFNRFPYLKLHTTVKNTHNSDTFISIIVTLICIKLINELPHINSNLALFYLSHILFIRPVHTIRRLLKCLIVKIYLKLMLIDFLSVSFLSSYHRDRNKKEKKFSFIKTATKAISDHFLWLSHGASYDFKNKMIK